MHTLQKCAKIIPSKDAEKLPRTARGAFFVPFDRKNVRQRSAQKERNHMSNQETKQEQIQFLAQQELKHFRTRCGKVYALGNNRFRAVVQTTPVHEYDAATHQWVELSAEKRQ